MFLWSTSGYNKSVSQVRQSLFLFQLCAKNLKRQAQF